MFKNVTEMDLSVWRAFRFRKSPKKAALREVGKGGDEFLD